MNMKSALSVIAAAAAALIAQGAFAQDAASAPKSRAEVKAEAKGAKNPVGEAGQPPAKEPASTKTKAERKAEAKGVKNPVGESGQPAPKEPASTKTKAERKAEAKQAPKNTTGEVTDPNKK